MPSLNSRAWNRLRYTLYAPVYDSVIRVFDAPRRRSISLLNPKHGDRILIVGCGSGRDFLFLPPHVQVVAGDITPAMVRRAETRAKRLGLLAQVSVLDAEAIGHPDDSFDSIILHLILAVVPNPQATIQEAARVLKSGGRVAIFDKFAEESRRPSLLRRGLNLLTSLLFTDITREVEPLLRIAGLRIVHEEQVFGGRFFRIITAEKPS